MKKLLGSMSLGAVVFMTMAATTQASSYKVYDEATLISAIAAANGDSAIATIVFTHKAYIQLSTPIIYTGTQAISLQGHGATIDGSLAGSFVLDEDLSAITEDGSLIFNTANAVSIDNLKIINSATRGVVVNVPADAAGRDVAVSLHKVLISGSALYGLHIDDNADDFDEGDAGSDVGIDLQISSSSFINNGVGAIDFDGVRVDERGAGDIHAMISRTHIDSNGGDGIELDEAGSGDVYATMLNVSLNDNGFYNEEDLDDGFDIDEADDGSIILSLMNVEVNNNLDEGLDFDEVGAGDVVMKLINVTAEHNADESIKVDEEGSGNIIAKLINVTVSQGGDDAVQLTEIGAGYIDASLNNFTAKNNAKYGFKAEQWFVEDEAVPVESAGSIRVGRIKLQANASGDVIDLNNINVQ